MTRSAPLFAAFALSCGPGLGPDAGAVGSAGATAGDDGSPTASGSDTGAASSGAADSTGQPPPPPPELPDPQVGGARECPTA